ncbi:MAG TPA: DNA repair protein RecO [Syntrophorhabdaceae bacterium]|jgi:DNA repair protein RecO (recombination protein O)
MGLHKDEAIVLSKRAYGESDRIVRLLTLESGKIGAIAKGASKSRKRFSNTLEPFNHIKVEYFEKSGSGLVRIDNADIVATNQGIEVSLKRACTASFFTEFSDRLSREREKNKALFYTLKEILETARVRELSYGDILYYQLKMLDVLGYMPNFRHCVYCGKSVADEVKRYFSRQRGGVLCPACMRSVPHRVYGEGTISRLVSIVGHDFAAPQTVCDSPMSYVSDMKRFEGEAREIMEGFISFHLEVELKSYRILKTLLWQP